MGAVATAGAVVEAAGVTLDLAPNRPPPVEGAGAPL